jgi:carboxypeptidase Q
MPFYPEPGAAPVYILLVGPREITPGKAEVINSIQQIGLANTVIAANAYDPFPEPEGRLLVVFELKKRQLLNTEQWKNLPAKYYLSIKLHCMKKISRLLLPLTLLLSAFCVPALLHAQNDQPDTAMADRIRQEEMSRSQIPFISHELTDVAGPRLTNSPGWHQAADWAVQTLKGWGLSKAVKEPWGQYGMGWSAEKTSLALKTPYYSPLIAYAIPWSGSTNGPVTASLFLVEKLDSAWVSAHLAQMRGKVLLVLTSPQDTVSPAARFAADATRYTDSALAALGDTYMLSKEELSGIIPHFLKMMKVQKMVQNSGALAALTGQGGKDGTVFVQSFVGYRQKDQPNMPKLEVAREDFLRLVRLVKDGREVKVELESDTRLYDQDLQGHNVVAEIPGTDPTLKSEVVMLGGHLDSWTAGTGATDNGAGSIVAMEAVRLLQTLGVKPKRTIRIALWDGEEEGLLGSFHYVKNHFGDPIDMKLKPEQGRISAYYNLDNGTGRIRGIFAQGNAKAAVIFNQWLQPFKDLGAATVSMHNTGSTDHLGFDAIGIPGFQFIQDPIDYETRTHHSNEDNYDHLQIEDMKQAALILASFVYNTAMRTEMIPRKPLPKPEKFIFDDLIP